MIFQIPTLSPPLYTNEINKRSNSVSSSRSLQKVEPTKKVMNKTSGFETFPSRSAKIPLFRRSK